jgi:hypothetical protein
MKKVIAILLLAGCLGIYIPYIVKNINLKQDCVGYLERASNANTIEMAAVELKTALDYIEENKLTEDHTSVLWETPDEDMGFWYKNLKASYNELITLSADATPLEKSNMLMKLRETLLEDSGDGGQVIYPDGLSRYPNNLMWGILMWLTLPALIGSGVLFIISYDDF